MLGPWLVAGWEPQRVGVVDINKVNQWREATPTKQQRVIATSPETRQKRPC